MANSIQPKLKDAAERFCSENQNMLFSKEEDAWYKFNGKFWEEADNEFETKTFQIWEHFELLHDVHLKNLRKLCKKNMAFIGSMNIQSEMYLNTPDGVIDFHKFMELHKEGVNHKDKINDWIRPHIDSKENRLTNITFASYNVNSVAPKRFLDFISDFFLGDKELIDYFCRFLAYCLTGKTSQQFIHVLYGIGRNGKSTIISIIKEILGSYFSNINCNKLNQANDSNATWRLFYTNRFKNLILFNELSEHSKLNLSMLKLLTGDDVLSVIINRRNVEFKVCFKPLINTNHLPEVGSIENKGIWERLRILNMKPPIPEEERIGEYYKTIVNEKDQILTYLIDNYLADVLSSGLRKKPRIMMITKAFKEFSENPVEFFFRSTCKLAYHPVNKNLWLQARFLYGQYFEFHLLVSKDFEKILKLREENNSRSVLVPTVSEPLFARIMERLGAFSKKSSEVFYTNLYFSAERVYSELGERVEDENLEACKSAFIDFYENTYIKKRRYDEFTSPIKQVIAMEQMANQPPEDYFEDNKPDNSIVISFNNFFNQFFNQTPLIENN